MSVVPYNTSRWQAFRDTLGYHRRVFGVTVAPSSSSKYADSVLGYSGRSLGLSRTSGHLGSARRLFGGASAMHNYPLYLLLGIVIFTYFIDAVGLQMRSIVERGGLLRKIYFPRLIIALSATGTATVTFAVNALVVVIFIAVSRITPDASWLLIFPLLGELYLFMLGLGLILAMAYTRFRDMGQFWDLASAAPLLRVAGDVLDLVSPARIRRSLC